MKPPRPSETAAAATESLLGQLSTALKAGRLVALLTGPGLTRNTVEELLRPEGAARLREILADHLSAPWDPSDPYAGLPPGPLPREGGRVLAFRAKGTSTP